MTFYVIVVRFRTQDHDSRFAMSWPCYSLALYFDRHAHVETVPSIVIPSMTDLNRFFCISIYFTICNCVDLLLDAVFIIRGSFQAQKYSKLNKLRAKGNMGSLISCMPSSSSPHYTMLLPFIIRISSFSDKYLPISLNIFLRYPNNIIDLEKDKQQNSFLSWYSSLLVNT